MGLSLTWVNNQGMVCNDSFRTAFSSKPSLSFAYDNLYYEPDVCVPYKIIGNTSYKLTTDEVKSVVNFIIRFDFSRRLVYGVNQAGEFLGVVPFNTVFKEVPIQPPDGAYWVWDFNKNDWKYVMAVDANGKYIGNVEPGTYAALVPQAPSQPWMVWDFQAAQWKDGRILDDFKDLKIEQIDIYIRNHIEAGFTSSALGSPYHYDYQLEDQINLADAVSLGTSVMYKCTDSSGNKTLVLHTASQIQTVRNDATNFKMQLLQQSAELKQQVAKIISINDLNNIVLP